MSIRPRRSSFRTRGHRLGFSDYDGGGAPVLLMPGLLFSREMHDPLATELARRGHRVLLLDPLGHGTSDRPRDMWLYSMPSFADDAVALLDHLGIDRAVVGGTSLGANITLELGSRYPDRLSGMLLEMPALEHALVAAAIAFAPLMVGLTVAERAMRLVTWSLRRIPKQALPFYAGLALDVVRQEPGPSGAVLQGLFFGRVAPPRDERRAITVPALVLGHRRDPIHPFSDAGMVARELPNSRLVEASSLFELRFTPARLTDEIDDFLRERTVRRRPRAISGGQGRARRARRAG
jgi:pimeloyl-ACP methyl ester carboxylesterase